jgi:hypothetical protein
VRRRAIRGDAAVSPRQSLPLLALPQALRDVRPDAGTRSARRLSIARRPRAAPRLPAAGRNGSQGLLLGLRLLTLRRHVAERRRSVDPARLARRRSADTAAVPLIRRFAGRMGRAARRRPPALRGSASGSGRALGPVRKMIQGACHTSRTARPRPRSRRYGWISELPASLPRGTCRVASTVTTSRTDP